MTDDKNKTKQFSFDPARVERMLDAPDASVKRTQDVDRWLSDDIKRWIGKQLGPFEITDYLDRGGMSLVFRGRRNNDQFEQEVAIKVLRAPDVQERVQRFQRERQLLARLETHSNIAHIIDGGVVDGQPWLAMELVDGDPVDSYCDEQQLGLLQRLELFIDVAKAVQFAHSHLIVHRDLKPSNILVTGEGQAKLLDFGIAKALQDHDSELTGADLLLTPMYASPEQVLGEPVGIASDVYQLGLLLYRLLTGRNAQALENPSVAEIKSAVVERDPLSPSRCVEISGTGDEQQLAQIASDRSIPTAKLRKRLSGDLDAIVLKALEKEPARRYSSVEKLIEDLTNFQSHRPVSARQTTGWYRVSRFARRHRGGVLAGTLTTLVIISALTAVAFSWRATIRAQNKALAEAEGAIEVGEFWAGLLQQASPLLSAGDELTVRELLEASSDQLDELDDKPRIQARLLEATAGAFEGLGLPERSEPFARRALAIREQLNDPVGSINALLELAVILMRLGDLDQSVELAQRALSIAVENNASPLIQANTHNTLANVLSQQGAHDQVQIHAKRTIELLQGNTDSDSKARLASAFTWVGANGLQQGKYVEARDAFQSALGFLGDSPSERVTRGWILRDLGQVYLELSDDEQAIVYLRQSLSQTRETFGDQHPNLLGNLVILGRALCRHSCDGEPEDLFKEALRIAEATLGKEHGNYARILHDYAQVFRQRGDFDQLRQVREEASLIADQFFGADHSTAVNLRMAQALIAQQSGQYRDALVPIEKVLPAVRQAFGKEHLITVNTEVSRAAALLQAERFTDANAAMLALVSQGKNLLGGKFRSYANNFLNLSNLHRLVGPIETANDYAESALSVHRSIDATESMILLRPLTEKIRVQVLQNPSQVMPDIRLALSVIAKDSAPPTIQTHYLLSQLAIGVAEAGLLEDSQRICQSALVGMQSMLTDDQPLLGYGRANCAEVSIRNQRQDEALGLLRLAIPVITSTLGNNSWRTQRALMLKGIAGNDPKLRDSAINQLSSQLSPASPLVQSLSKIRY